MRDIKTKKVNKAPRTLSKAARVPRDMLRHSAYSAKDGIAENTGEDSRPQESAQGYATENLERFEKDSAQHGSDTVQDVSGRAMGKLRDKRVRTKQAGRTERPSTSSKSNGNAAKAGRNRTVNSARKARNASHSMRGGSNIGQYGQPAKQTSKKAVQAASGSTKKTVKQTAKQTIKTAQKGVKAAKRTVRAGTRVIKTTAQAARGARLAAQTAARAAQMARLAAKAAVAAAKLAIKILMAIIKAIIAAIKALITALAAGGWVVALVIIIIAVIAFVVGSVFGIFFSNDEDTNTYTVQEIVEEINADFSAKIQAEIDSLTALETYDEVKIMYDGDGDDSVSNWADIIGVYAGRAMYDEMEVITVNEEHKAMLKETFDVMSSFSITHEVQTAESSTEEDPQASPAPTPGATTGPAPAETVEPEPEEVRKTLIIYVTIASMDYRQGADHYNFNDDQREMLEEMMSPAYYSLFAELLGTGLYGDSDLPTIISNLPPGEFGSAIAEAALKYVGMPYSQEAGKRGVTHLDCSLLVKWAYRDAGVDIPDVSVEQARYCKENNRLVSLDSLQPGDIIFWTKTTCHCGRMDEIHHVGIYLGGNQVVEASFGKGRVVVGNLWETSKWKIAYAARP